VVRREDEQGDQRNGEAADGDEVQARFHVTEEVARLLIVLLLPLLG
jgi:hypothetical protein